MNKANRRLRSQGTGICLLLFYYTKAMFNKVDVPRNISTPGKTAAKKLQEIIANTPIQKIRSLEMAPISFSLIEDSCYTA